VTIYFSPAAEQDFAALIGYLAERNPAAAVELGQRIFAMIDQLARGDFEGPEQTLEPHEVVRSWPVPPVRVCYQRRADAFWVVRIYNQARPPVVR